MRYLLIALGMLSINVADSQVLDREIKALSNDLGGKIVRKNRKVVALLDFKNEKGIVNSLTKYIQEHVEDNLINSPGIEVMDRKHIDLLLSENKLQSEGLLDERLARSATKFIRIDGWIVGEITGLGKEIKIKLKVIDINNSQVFASSVSDNITDDNIGTLSGLRNCRLCQGTGLTKLVSSCTDCNGKKGRVCGTCKGTGKMYAGLSRDKKRTCETCDGKGKFVCLLCNDTGQMTVSQTCSACEGKGNTIY
jgi:hypothetical protein